MCNTRAFSLGLLVLLVVLHYGVIAQVSARKSNRASRWHTLSGKAPLVVARGGFSGIFADSSVIAYKLAGLTSVPGVILWCDVQLTKDAAGICFPDLNLDNGSNIATFFKDQRKTYLVNGASTSGWFPTDYTLSDLSIVSLSQGVYSRTVKFDGNLYPILTVDYVATQFKPSRVWLNIQHDSFYTQRNLSMKSFVLSISKSVSVSYISSPEVNFLRSIAARFRPSTTKLFFRFLGQTEIEPTTNLSYLSLSKNLTFIKTFASGILVPKDYILQVDKYLYSLSNTSIVSDAHSQGLEVFASNFANDVPFSFNYSYDPLAEYLSFIDNGKFSVDGVLSDFPITPSAAIRCFAHLGKNASKQVNLLVMSNNGASGDFPGCTDRAYQKAILDGVDVIDCPVQMSEDGIPFCLSSINLISSTRDAQSQFSNLSRTYSEISSVPGIFTFDLKWETIQNLTPEISNPYFKYHLLRNPKEENTGKFLKLSGFLDMAKRANSLYGVLISIENAAYLAKRGMSVIDEVIKALSNAGYDNQTSLKVLIQSTNSSVLMKFKEKNSYELIYKIEEPISDAFNSTVEDIKKFAHSVIVNKDSVFPENGLFTTGATDVVAKLQSFQLLVYVETFRNEFVSQAWDFFSDATVEINSYVSGTGINGVITDYPKTAVRYRRNRCLNRSGDPPPYMTPIQPAGLWSLITLPYLPPAEAPNPILRDSDVVESPLPSVRQVLSPTPGGNTEAVPKPPAPTPPNGQHKFAACIFLSSMAPILAALLFL